MIFKKTLISEFFTTVSFNQVLNSGYLMTFGIFKFLFGSDIKLLENQLLKYLSLNNSTLPSFFCKTPSLNIGSPVIDDRKIISFYNGRSAIYNTLKLIGISEGDEVITSGYTCSVVSNSIIQSGANIVYNDIEKTTLSLDVKDLKKNITTNTKVIIIQDTFGKQSCNYKDIINLAREKNIVIIEDRALSLGNNTQILGDFAIYSTGRDKVISSVTGGFLLVNNINSVYEKFNLKEKIKKLEQDLEKPTFILIIRNLLYNIVGYKAYKFYDFFSLGKIIIFISRKLNLITEILSFKEKNFKKSNFNLGFSSSLAYLAKKELLFLDKYTSNRLLKSKYYIENIANPKIEIIFKELSNYNGFRFPILLNSEGEKNSLYSYMKKNNVLLGNYWTGQNIIPSGIDLKNAKYIKGSCNVSEDISKRILTLPNHKLISKKDLSKVAELLNLF